MSYNASAITKIFLSSALYFIWHPWALNLLSMIDTPNCLIVVGFVPRLRLLGQPYKGWENIPFLSVSMSSHLPLCPCDCGDGLWRAWEKPVQGVTWTAPCLCSFVHVQTFITDPTMGCLQVWLNLCSKGVLDARDTEFSCCCVYVYINVKWGHKWVNVSCSCSHIQRNNCTEIKDKYWDWGRKNCSSEDLVCFSTWRHVQANIERLEGGKWLK